MMMNYRFLACLLAFSTVFAARQPATKTADKIESTSGRLLVLVNGKAVTEGDLKYLMLTRRVPKELQPSVRKQFLEELIDQRLIQAYLKKRKFAPSKLALDVHVERIHRNLRRTGKDPKQVLAELGYSDRKLRQELAISLAWRTYIRLIVPAKQLREFWKQHRQEFDGTQVRAAHIVLKAKTNDEIAAAEKTLKKARADIVAGKMTFAEAVKKHSESPSRKTGGDLGFFPYRGRMPVSFSKVAFPLKVGEVSQPFRTPFGVHLLTVTERKPGQLSLEDVRPKVLDQIADQIRRELLQKERPKAKIEWKVNIP